MSTIRKRKRENEVKKWTDVDIRKVLCYMQAHRNIEKPTARLYYEKLLEETKIDANWNILKCKVRHLKGTLQKAEAWRRKAGARLADGNGATSIKDKVVHKICPHYDQLSDIFATIKEMPLAVMDTSYDAFNNISNDAIDIKDESLEVSNDAFDHSSQEGIDIKNEILEENDDVFDYNAPDTINNINDENLVIGEEATTSYAVEGYNVKQRDQKTSVHKLTAIEIERTKFWEKQLKLEIEKFEWTKEVEKKKLEMDRIKIDNEFQLKKLELEQNERIKMFEIEMKYKNNK